MPSAEIKETKSAQKYIFPIYVCIAQKLPFFPNFLLPSPTHTAFPSSLDRLARVEVVYKTLPGWQTSTEACRRFEDLPAAARDYVKAIEDILHVPVRWVGVGASRDAMITRW